MWKFQLKSSQILSAALLLFLLFPFITLVFFFRLDFELSATEFWWALKNSVTQSFFSAFFSVLLGIFLSFGIFCVQRHWSRAFLEFFCLVPGFLPPLFTLISVFNFLDPFPMGVVGVVVVHTLMNFGLVAVLFTHHMENHLGGVVEQAWIEGSTRLAFLWKILFPLMKKEILALFIFVFALCFSSFSVPLVVGGGRATSLEILIYEKIRLSSDWGGAVFLSLMQSVFIFALSLLAFRGRDPMKMQRANFQWIRSRSALGVLILILSLFIFGYLQGLVDGFSQLHFFYELRQALFFQLLGSLTLGLSSGIFVMIFLLMMAFVQPRGFVDRFFQGFLSPSTALTGFAFLVFYPNEDWSPWIKIPLGFVLLNLNTLYRMGWALNIRALRNQTEMASVLGASRVLSFRWVELPQLISRACFFAGLVALWMVGDFGISRILAHRDLSLGLATETLLSGYHINKAAVLSLVVLILGLILFLFFVGVGRVLRRKLEI